MPELIRLYRFGYFMNGIYLLLGSNLGDRLATIQGAITHLEQKGVKMVKKSSVYDTAPWGITAQPYFLNAVIEVQTAATPHELLQFCLETETALGRVRSEKWGARIIDIDILFYRNVQLKEVELTIPHPGIAERHFTLLPLCDLIPHEKHPITGQTLNEMLALLPNNADCQKTDLVLGS